MDDKQTTNIQFDEIFDPMQYLGKTLNTAKDEYEILNYLGEGLTAVVFKARQISTASDCALKLLRPTASSLSQENFREELSIIRKLRSNGLQSVPNVLDYQKDQAPEFLVMDLVSSDEYPGLHLLSKSNSKLKEDEALMVFREALILLEKLHTDEQRTYIDMQLKNFCWNSTEHRLIVMDWNHVSYSKEVIETELNKEPDQRNVDVMQQLRGRGARDFDELVRLDLRRLTAYFYTLVTGKSANELGETVWSLENRAGEDWKTISLPSRQIVLQVLTPRDVQGKLDSAAKILAEVDFAQELLGTNDIDYLQNKFDEVFDRASNIERQEQPDIIYRAAAYLDRIERINDPRVDRWLNSQRSRLHQGESFESADWSKGRNFFRVGSYAEARRYWDQEAEALGKVHLWRWALLARIYTDTSGTLSDEKQQILTQRLELAIENLQQGDIQRAKTNFQSTQELISQEVIDWWLEEIQALMLLENLEPSFRLNEPGETADILIEVADLSFWDNLPYARILLRDDIWYLTFQKILGLSQAEELRSKETVNLQEVLQNLAQELRMKQQEISISSDLLASFLNLDFGSFKDELKGALYKKPDNPELVRGALDYINNRRAGERLEVIDILSSWAHLNNDLKAKVMDCRKELYRSLFEELTTEASEAIENRNLPLALDYFYKGKLALRALHGFEEDEKVDQEKIIALNDRIGKKEDIEKQRWNEARILQLSFEIEELIKLSKIMVDEIESKMWSTELGEPADADAALEGLKENLDQLETRIMQMPDAEKGVYSAMHTKLTRDYNRCTKLGQSNDLQVYKNYFVDAKKRLKEIEEISTRTGKRADAELQHLKERVKQAQKIKNNWIRTNHSEQAR